MRSVKGRSHGHRYVRLDDPLYRVSHYVFFGPLTTAGDAITAVTGRTVDLPTNAAGGVFRLEAEGIVRSTIICVFKGVMVNEYLDTLCHETHHATAFTLLSEKTPLSHDTVELYAQYHEWLFREGRRGVGL